MFTWQCMRINVVFLVDMLKYKATEITCGAVGHVDTNQIYDPCVKSQWAGREKEKWQTAGERERDAEN